MRNTRAILAAVVAAILVFTAGAMADVFNLPAGQTSLVMVPVGNAGNVADTKVMTDGTTGYGQVNYTYSIGKYDVTVGQYTAFLNAVAKTDTYGLYNSNMGSGDPTFGCGISQTGSPGSYSYAPTKNANFPVNYVTFWDSCRFANWLQNNQPTGVNEGVGTTETGAYDLTVPNGIANATITRSTGATWAVTSENEWYKAAYYDPSLNSDAGGYWYYPTKSNDKPSNVLSATGTNNANFYDYGSIGNGGYTDPVNYLTPVGAFAASPSAYGTYDQGGDLWQWNDSNIAGQSRGLRGDDFYNYSWGMQSNWRNFSRSAAEESFDTGFRVVEVPEPATPHPGDANNDGAVDVVDLGVLAKNYDSTGLPHGSGQSWGLADFNDDGNVDVIDLGVLAKNYDWGGTPAGAVPEPATLSLLALGGMAMLRRRHV